MTLKLTLQEAIILSLEKNMIDEIVDSTLDILNTPILGSIYSGPEMRNLLEKKIRKQLESILSLSPTISAYDKLVVVKGLQTDRGENGSWNSSYYYDCFMVASDDTESYSIDLVDWRELAGLEVDHNSILNYSLPTVLASILFDMSFCGFTYEDASVNQEKFIDKMLQSLSELEAESKALEDCHCDGDTVCDYKDSNIQDCPREPSNVPTCSNESSNIPGCHHSSNQSLREMFDLEPLTDEEEMEWQEKIREETEYYKKEKKRILGH